jgi:hypothetical protein
VGVSPLAPVALFNSERATAHYVFYNENDAYRFKNETNTIFNIIFFSIDVSQIGVSAQALVLVASI